MVRVAGTTKRLHMPRHEYVNSVVPIGALYAASLWLSNSAYLHLSVSFIQARSISHWFPYDRVGVVNADP